MKKEMHDIRDCFFDEVLNLATENNNIVVVTNDMDVFSLRLFREKFPRRFINVGVAEQNMINIAAGLAVCEKKVIIYGITPFLIYRCFEQIKFNVCSMNLPVVLAGIGTGLSFSYDGPTHHATHDIAVLRSLPELEIYNPGDTFSAGSVARYALNNNKPTFVRIDKGNFPSLNNSKSIIDNAYSILKPLNDINIVTTGSMTQRAINISESFNAMGVNIGVIDLFKLKPLSELFIKTLVKNSKKIIVIEEHESSTGLGIIISDICALHMIPVFKFGTKDEQIFSYGDRDWLLRSMGLDTKSLVHNIKNII